MKLLDYVAIYGLILMPIGGIVLAEHWLFPWLGLKRYQAEKKRKIFNWKVLAVWLASLVFAFSLPLHLYFKWLPSYVFTLFLYVLLNLSSRERHEKNLA